MAMESNRAIESIENNIAHNSKDGKALNIADTLSTNKDEQALIVNKIAIQNMIENLNTREKEIILLR